MFSCSKAAKMYHAKFGLLKYDNTDNVGDEIQSLAARRFLPRVDYYIDRERMNAFVANDERPAWVVLNGWYCHHPENWPPSQYINPLILSFHINPSNSYSMGLLTADAMLNEPAVKYLHGFAPIGARDLRTLELLKKSGVDSYFSGCLTLTIDRPKAEQDDDLIVLCDVPGSVNDYVSAEASRRRVERVSHGGCNPLTAQQRFERAEGLLSLYASAGCVITTRLHCALPCVAMGTPVILLDAAPDQERFSGLHEFVRHCSVKEFLSPRKEFDFLNPQPNPDRHLPLRKALSDRVSAFIEAANRGDAAPPSPLTIEDRYQALSVTVMRIAAKVQEDRERLERLEEEMKRLAVGCEQSAARE
jgi:hypothetical protein